MNKLQFEIQVMKAAVALKRKQVRNMKDGPAKKKVMANINKASTFLKKVSK
jgi:hypothetical protein